MWGRVHNQVTEKTTTFQARSSGYSRAGFIGRPGKALTWDATRKLRFDVHAADLQHSMVLLHVVVAEQTTAPTA